MQDIEIVKQDIDWSDAKKEVFLMTLAKTFGNVSAASKEAGFSRTWMYALKSRDPEFSTAWDEAVHAAVDIAEQELYRRGVEGVDRPVYQSKELVGMIREYDTTALIFLLKGRRPETWNPPQKIASTNIDGTQSMPLVVMLPESWGQRQQIEQEDFQDAGSTIDIDAEPIDPLSEGGE